VVVPLFTRFPLHALAASCFPLFYLLANVFESDDVSLFPSRDCRSDLALYLHSVLDGAAAFDPSLLAELKQGASARGLSAAGACAQHMALSVGALGGEVPAVLDTLFLGNRTGAEELLVPTPWPVWQALHFMSRARGQQPLLGRTASPRSFHAVAVDSPDRPPFESIAARLRRTDFNGWTLPSWPFESEDDRWTVAMDAELEKRTAEKKRSEEAPLPRVAFLESQMVDVFGGFMNFDYREVPVTRAYLLNEKEVFVPYSVFQQEWAAFISDPDLSVSRHGKTIGNYEKGFLGFVHAWKADFLTWPKAPNASHLELLAAYDILIVMDEFPKGHPPVLPAVDGQVRLWQPMEPLHFRTHFTRVLPEDYCPTVLDTHGVAAAPSVLLYHYYMVSDWHRALPPPYWKQNAGSVGLGGPVAYLFYGQGTADLEVRLQGMGYQTLRAPEGANISSYFQALQKAAVAIIPPLRTMSRPSCGQAIADAAIAGCVPTFSPRTKVFARLLNPAFLSYRTEEELISKLKLLRDNPHWFELLSREVCRRLRYVDTAFVEDPWQLLQRVQLQSPGDRRCHLRSHGI
ncbi:unnamed protein product, partial [Polarella glacialis]